MDFYLFRRILRRMRGKVAVEDCDYAVCEALRKMKVRQMRNRERALPIMTSLSSSRAEHARAVSQSSRLEREMARPQRKRTGRRPVSDLARDKYLYDMAAALLLPKVQEFERALESVKQMIRREEADFRVATAKAIANSNLIRAEVCMESLRKLRKEYERLYPSFNA